MAKKENAKIVISKNGPYLVSGNLPLFEEMLVPDRNGMALKWKKGKKFPAQKTCGLCRCGETKNAPFCDGAHVSINFDGTETASNKKYSEIAEKIAGPKLVLADARELCAGAGFCYRAGGTWKLTKESDNPKSRKIAIQETWDCPAGRLVVRDKKGKLLEPKFPPSIGIIEHPDETSGPIWVKGKVSIESADGKKYEIRNRVTLCRCGKSRNMPFCDSTHNPINFSSKKKK